MDHLKQYPVTFAVEERVDGQWELCVRCGDVDTAGPNYARVATWFAGETPSDVMAHFERVLAFAGEQYAKQFNGDPT